MKERQNCFHVASQPLSQQQPPICNTAHQGPYPPCFNCYIKHSWWWHFDSHLLFTYFGLFKSPYLYIFIKFWKLQCFSVTAINLWRKVVYWNYYNTFDIFQISVILLISFYNIDIIQISFFSVSITFISSFQVTNWLPILK